MKHAAIAVITITVAVQTAFAAFGTTKMPNGQTGRGVRSQRLALARFPAPPEAPVLSFSSPVTSHDTAQFGASAWDPDGDDVYIKFYFDLGADTNLNSGWLGPVPNDAPVTVMRFYGVHGRYPISARAMDMGGDTSPLSPIETLVVQTVGIGWRFPFMGWDEAGGVCLYPPVVKMLPDSGLSVITWPEYESAYAFTDYRGNRPATRRVCPDGYETPSPSDAPSLSSDESHVYCPADNYRVYYLSSADLSTEGTWPASFDSVQREFCVPAVVNDRLYVGRGDSVVCLIDDGSALSYHSSYHARSGISYPAVVNEAGDRIFFGTDSGYFICMDSSCSVVWRSRTGGAPTCAGAINDNGIVYLGRADGRLYGYAQNDSVPVLTTQPMAQSIVGCPVIDAAGIIYTVREDASVEAYPGLGANVAPLWTVLQFDAGCEAAPCLAPDTTVIIHTSDDVVIALRCSDGTRKWSLKLPWSFKRVPASSPGRIHSSPCIGPTANRIYTGSDNMGFFYAIDVESLDHAGTLVAPWPKFQHDLHNSGWKGQPLIDAAGEMRQAKPVAGVSLAPLCPNPFSSRTLISFGTTGPGRVELVIYNAAGQLVRTLADEQRARASQGHLAWDGTGQNGRVVSNGIYFCRLTASGQSVTRSVVLLR